MLVSGMTTYSANAPSESHSDDFYVLANMGVAGAALQALSAGHMHFRRNKVALLHAGDFVSQSDYVSAKLMPWN